MSEPTYPVLGPCSSWVTAEDVMECCGIDECDAPGVLEDVAHEAGLALYELSGRVFPGVCTRTVRPCADRCGCWGGGSPVATPWFWTYNVDGAYWGWWNADCGDRCGCRPLEVVPLAGYPVQRIVEVLIDGAVVPAGEYRLDNRRELVRTDDPGPPVVRRTWPGCQNLALEDDQPGTFSITYEWGMDPPPIAKDAAAELACQLFRSCSGGAGGDCAIPPGVTRIDRQGVTIERSLLTHFLDPSTPTGLPALDLFLRSYAGAVPARRAAVWSPDIQAYGRRVTG